MREVSSFILCINDKKGSKQLLHLKAGHLTELSMKSTQKGTSVCLAYGTRPVGFLRQEQIPLVHPVAVVLPHTGPEAGEAWQWPEH